jgi:hypothetical protein
MPRDSVDHGAHGTGIGVIHFHHQVFFTMNKRSGVREIQELNPRVRHFGGHGLMAKIETTSCRCRTTHDPREEDRGRQKIEVRELRGISSVP